MAQLPLNNRTAVVNPDGTPTQYFIRILQERGITLDDKITAEQALQIVEDWAADRDIIAGVGLSGGGDLSSDVTIDLEDTAVTPGSYTNADITVDAQGRLTAAANGSGGGGGGGMAFGPCIFAANGVAGDLYASYGQVYQAITQDLEVEGIILHVTPATTTAEYTVKVADLTLSAPDGWSLSGGSVTVGTELGSKAFIPGFTTGRWMVVKFDTPVSVSGGSDFCVIVSRTDATSTTSPRTGFINTSASPPLGLGAPVRQYYNMFQIANTNPIGAAAIINTAAAGWSFFPFGK